MTQARPIISSPHSSEIEAEYYHYLAYSPIDRILQRISRMELPGGEHIESYMRHKWRMNHKPSTLKGSFLTVSSFLTFYAGLAHIIHKLSVQAVLGSFKSAQGASRAIRMYS